MPLMPTLCLSWQVSVRERKTERMAEMEHSLTRHTTAMRCTGIVSAVAAVVFLTLVVVPLWRMQIRL